MAPARPECITSFMGAAHGEQLAKRGRAKNELDTGGRVRGQLFLFACQSRDKLIQTRILRPIRSLDRQWPRPSRGGP